MSCHYDKYANSTCRGIPMKDVQTPKICKNSLSVDINVWAGPGKQQGKLCRTGLKNAEGKWDCSVAIASENAGPTAKCNIKATLDQAEKTVNEDCQYLLQGVWLISYKGGKTINEIEEATRTLQALLKQALPPSLQEGNNESEGLALGDAVEAAGALPGPPVAADVAMRDAEHASEIPPGAPAVCRSQGNSILDPESLDAMSIYATSYGKRLPAAPAAPRLHYNIIASIQSMSILHVRVKLSSWGQSEFPCMIWYCPLYEAKPFENVLGVGAWDHPSRELSRLWGCFLRCKNLHPLEAVQLLATAGRVSWACNRLCRRESHAAIFACILLMVAEWGNIDLTRSEKAAFLHDVGLEGKAVVSMVPLVATELGSSDSG